VELFVYELDSQSVGVGFSGGPVWEPNHGRIVGMCAAVEVNPGAGQTILGYVIPIQEIRRRLENWNLGSSSPNKDTSSDVQRGKKSDKKYVEAIGVYDRVINNENYNTAWNNKCRDLYEMGKTEESIACFTLVRICSVYHIFNGSDEAKRYIPHNSILAYQIQNIMS
jgi:hypothetical protein